VSKIVFETLRYRFVSVVTPTMNPKRKGPDGPLRTKLCSLAAYFMKTTLHHVRLGLPDALRLGTTDSKAFNGANSIEYSATPAGAAGVLAHTRQATRRFRAMGN
jgi:hypothetical protein